MKTNYLYKLQKKIFKNHIGFLYYIIYTDECRETLSVKYVYYCALTQKRTISVTSVTIQTVGNV